MSSNGNIFRVTGPLCPTQRPVTWSFDVFFDLRLNKRLSKQSLGWLFETPLWRHCNGLVRILPCVLFSHISNNIPQNNILSTYEWVHRQIIPLNCVICHLRFNHRNGCVQMISNVIGFGIRDANYIYTGIDLYFVLNQVMCVLNFTDPS